ncbi:hypothetical protein BKA69DRAFT_1018450, partial [Paraphysoderma sedebokerense]
SWKYTPRSEHPLYSTTSNQYGARLPTPFEIPKTIYSVSQRFTEHLNKSGPYRNHSLN